MTEHDSTRVAVAGYGSAGRAFSLALQRSGWTVAAVAEQPGSEGWRQAEQDGHVPRPLHDLPREPLVVIAVRDGDIEPVARKLAARWRNDTPSPGPNKPVAFHLAGSLGANALAPLAGAGYALLAFHPIQTFPPGAEPDRLQGITVGITGEPAALAQGRELARALGAEAVEIPESQRVRYHLASVIVSNFLPLLLENGAEQLSRAAEDADSPLNPRDAARALLPLMRGMLDSLADGDPGPAITGPIARNDRETVHAHLQVLREDEGSDGIYRRLSLALAEQAHRAGRLDREQLAAWASLLKQE